MAETTHKIDYRLTGTADETDILAVLEEVAPEIPVSFEMQNVQENALTEIAQCCRDGKSWVAVDTDWKVIGFALARADLRETGKAISLKFIGVSKGSRAQGIFTALIEKLKTSGVPLTASVLHGNQSTMVDHLLKRGFTKVEADAKETRFR